MTKIVTLDIENSPNVSYTWGKYEQNVIDFEKEWWMLSFAYKWMDKKKVQAYSLPDFKNFKKDRSDDSELIKKLWEVFDEADIVIGHNCVEENTPVLKQDLTWVKAGELERGDRVVGFDEGNKPGETFRNKKGMWRGTKESVRRVRGATVKDNYTQEKDCYEVLLSNGEKIITTLDHYWLGKTGKDNFYKWIKTEDIKPGYRFTKFWNIWEEEDSYEAGWLSGFLAGEGCLHHSGKSFVMTMYQRAGSTWDKALDYCSRLGISVIDRKTHASGIGRKDTQTASFLGGKFKIAEIVGRLNISRFKEKIDWDTFGGLKGQNLKTISVMSVRPVGKKRVAVLSTDKKTFFAQGYAMHNCDRFDVRKTNARFLSLGLKPPSPYKTIDTYKVAKKYFFLNSNKLTDLAKYLGLGQKEETGGFKLWLDCMAGVKRAWKQMVKYNKHDVALTEEVYYVLKPWITNHPNLNLFDGTEANCPKCASNKLQRRGYDRTRVSIFQRWQCQACFGWSRSRVSEKINKPEIV